VLFRSSARPPATTAPDVRESSAPDRSAEIATDLAQASQSLVLRDFPGAIASAERVLALSPDHGDAVRIRNEARDLSARFEAAIADAQNQLALGNASAAAKALATAASIAPSNPVIGELSNQLSARYAEEVRRQAAQTEEALRQARRAAADAAAARRSPVGPAPSTSAPQTARTTPPPVAPEPAPRAELPPPTSQPATPPAATPPATTPPPATSSSPPASSTPPSTATAPPITPSSPPPSQPEPAARAPSPAPPRETEADIRAADERAIRQLLSTYERAIEQRDIALFRSVKPNLSSIEETRLRESFRAVRSQEVDIRILSIDLRSAAATVRLARRDTIADDRQHTVDSQQTITLTKTDGRWVITSIGG
jgi:tetratricopeptide (TPR) repeat protein